MSSGRLADLLPLSPAQEGLLYHALLGRESTGAYVVQALFRVDGPVDDDALRRAVAALLARHPNLRACFRYRGLDQPVQLIAQRAAVPWAETDLSRCGPAELTAKRARLMSADRSRRFDVTRPPLVRCTLLRCGPGSAELLLTMHHILIDGWSMPILARDLAALYTGSGAELPPAPPYRDYLAWLRGQDDGPAMQAWRSALSGVEPTLLAPEATPRTVGQPDDVEFELAADLSTAVRRRARESGVTANTLAQAAWGLTLARMTGADDVVFGAVVSGRPPELPGVEAMVGLLINTLPVRVRLRPGERVGELLTRLQCEQLQLAPHHHLRLAEVQRLAGPGELFDTVLAFENYPRNAGQAPGAGLQLVKVHDATHYPLTLTMVAGDRFWLRLSHYRDRLGPGEAAAAAARLVRAFEVLAGDPHALADQIDILPEPERHRLLVSWNATARVSSAQSVPDRFAALAARTPHAVAVESADRVVTYAALDSCANNLAAHLIAAGVGPETSVAILLDRSPELVIAQLAVLKAGGCYVPLDPAQPGTRLRWLLRDTGARIVLANGTPGWLPAGSRIHAVTGLPEQAALTPPPTPRPDAAAYVMYTSGSTGAPKGVVATHRNVVELAADRCFGTEAHRRVLLHSPYTFDAATYELWVPLLTGGTVVIPAPGPLEVSTLKWTLAYRRITALWLTAELFRTVADLVPDALAGLREVWAGGDTLAPQAVRRIQEHCPDITVVNGYGPTEATTFVTCHPIRRPAAAGPVSIGRPLDNTCAYVLDRCLRPAPAGTVGELYLSGTGLARGYLNQPGLTAERFVAAPHAAQPGARMYRTGDLARWTVDGNLELAGRADAQLKILGFRIEPGEPEAVLESCAGVHRAVVAARVGPGGKWLVAYLVLTAEADLDDIRSQAADWLPAHLLPVSYVPVDRIPLTPHGKVDRAALSAPKQEFAAARPAAGPRAPAEQALCELFAKVLGVPEFGPDMNFFEAGGHSLLAMRLVVAAEAALGTCVPISSLYDRPTPAALAERLGRAAPASGPAAPALDAGLSPVLTLRAAGDRTPLFCLPPAIGLGWSYTALLPHLPGRPVHALQQAALPGDAPLATSIGQLAEGYLARIRAVQPDGPYLLLGSSFGGLLGYELAARLQRAGQQVGLLAVLDAAPLLSAEAAESLLDPAAVEHEALLILLSQAAPPVAVPPGQPVRAAVFAAVRRGGGPLGGASDRRLATLADICAWHICLARSYQPPRFHGPVLLFSASGGPNGLSSAAKAAAWRRTAADVRVHELDCAHSEVMLPAPVAEIATVLAPILREY